MFMLAVVPNGLLAKDSPRSRSGKSSLRGGLTKRPKADIGSVVSQKTCEVPKGKFPWNFEKAKIVDIVDQVSRITCKNFILSSGVKANEDS